MPLSSTSKGFLSGETILFSNTALSLLLSAFFSSTRTVWNRIGNLYRISLTPWFQNDTLKTRSLYFSNKGKGRHKILEFFRKFLLIFCLPLGTPHFFKMDEFSENLKTAFDPSPPHFRKVILRIYNVVQMFNMIIG